MTMHLIKSHVFTHGSCVTKINLASMTYVSIRDARVSEACMILLLAVVLQSHVNRWLKTKQKVFGYARCV